MQIVVDESRTPSYGGANFNEQQLGRLAAWLAAVPHDLRSMVMQLCKRNQYTPKPHGKP